MPKAGLVFRKNISPLQGQAGQRSYRDRAGLDAFAGQLILLLFKYISRYRLQAGIHNPLLLHTVFFVEVELSFRIAAGVTRRYDFDNPIGGAQAASVIKLGWVAYHVDAGLHYAADLLVTVGPTPYQPHIQRSVVHLARLTASILVNCTEYIPRICLM